MVCNTPDRKCGRALGPRVLPLWWRGQGPGERGRRFWRAIPPIVGDSVGSLGPRVLPLSVEGVGERVDVEQAIILAFCTSYHMIVGTVTVDNVSPWGTNHPSYVSTNHPWGNERRGRGEFLVIVNHHHRQSSSSSIIFNH